MIEAAPVFIAYLLMFAIVIRALINPVFARMITSVVTPADAVWALAVIVYVATWSESSDARRAAIGVAVLGAALMATAEGRAGRKRRDFNDASETVTP